MPTTHQWTIVHVDNPVPTKASSTQLLREAGYRVIEASTNEEACSVAAREGSVLLLLCETEEFRILADHAPALLWVNGPDGCEFSIHGHTEKVGKSHKGGVSDEFLVMCRWPIAAHPSRTYHRVSNNSSFGMPFDDIVDTC